MIREILKMGDECLLRVAEPVPDEMFDTPELWQLIDDMLQTMEHAGGVGLAAPQIVLTCNWSSLDSSTASVTLMLKPCLRPS